MPTKAKSLAQLEQIASNECVTLGFCVAKVKCQATSRRDCLKTYLMHYLIRRITGQDSRLATSIFLQGASKLGYPTLVQQANIKHIQEMHTVFESK